MEIAHISPTQFLDKYSSNYHMILASVADRSPMYVDFYREASGTKILDNGMFELLAPLNNKDLLEMARDLRPDILVLPDVKDDFSSTLDDIEVARRVFKDLPCKKMAVIQGRSLPELDTMFWILQEMQGIDVIGLPKRMPVDRAGFLNRVNMRSSDIGKPVHLLGCNAMNAVAEIRTASHYPWVQGIDTTLAVKLGLSGIVLHPSKGPVTDIKRSKRYFDIADDSFQGIISYNITVMNSWAIGATGPSWTYYWTKVQEIAQD